MVRAVSHINLSSLELSKTVGTSLALKYAHHLATLKVRRWQRRKIMGNLHGKILCTMVSISLVFAASLAASKPANDIPDEMLPTGPVGGIFPIDIPVPSPDAVS